MRNIRQFALCCNRDKYFITMDLLKFLSPHLWFAIWQVWFFYQTDIFISEENVLNILIKLICRYKYMYFYTCTYPVDNFKAKKKNFLVFLYKFVFSGI